MSNLCQIDQFFLIRFHIISNMMSDVCIYFNLFCKFVIQVQKLRKYIKIYQFSFNFSFSNCKRSKDSLEKKKLIFNFHVEYLFKKSNSEIPLSKIHPKFTGNASDVNKENLYKWNFLSLVPIKISIVFYKVERNMLLDQTTFGGVEARILLSSSLRQVFEEPTYFRIPIGAVL